MKLTKFVAKNKVRFIMLGIVLVLLIVAGFLNYFHLFTSANDFPIAQKFYVATNGNDSWSGNLDSPNAANTDGPFATIQQAQTAVRAYIATSSSNFTGANVYIRKGTYNLSQTILLTAADSGENGRKVSYLNYPGEKPVIRGSKDLTGWTAPDSKGIITKDLTDPSLGLDPNLNIAEVYFNGGKQILAQTPNFIDPNFNNTDPYAGNWLFANTAPPVAGSQPTCGDNNNLYYDPTTISASQQTAIGLAIASTNKPMVSIFPQQEWSNQIVDIKQINPGDVKKIVTAQQVGDDKTKICRGNRFVVQNYPEALDNQKEWYQNTTEHTLSYMPAHTLTATDRVSIPVLDRAFQLKKDAADSTGPHDIKIEGLTFEEFGRKEPPNASSSSQQGTVIVMSNSNNIEISNNIVKNSAAWGIYAGSGSTNINIHQNQISGLARSAIYVAAHVSYNSTLVEENIKINDNTIHDVAYKYNGNPGILLLYSYKAEISHNYLYNLPRAGITFSANDTTIDNNKIENINLLTQDNAAIYMYGRLNIRGNFVNNNFIKKTNGYGRHYWYNPGEPMQIGQGTFGVYFDTLTSGNTAENNIVIDAARGCLDNNGGSYNTYNNNYCINSGTDDIGTQTLLSEDGPTYVNQRTELLDAYNKKATLSYWLDRSFYENKYPELKTIADTDPATLNLGEFMTKNTFTNNIFYYPNSTSSYAYRFTNLGGDQTIDYNLFYYDTSPIGFKVSSKWNGTIDSNINKAQWQAYKDAQFDKNSFFNQNPLFNSVSTGNFTLATNSPAKTLGIQQIYTSEVGPRKLEAPTITLVSPAEDGFVTHTDSVTVNYIVNDENTSQTFTGLKLGENNLTITATNPIPNDQQPPLTATRTLKVIYAQAPVIVIVTPPDGFVTNVNFITVTYTVDGVNHPPQTFNNLTLGENTLTITATNPYDPTLIATATVKVFYDPVPGPDIVILSPADRSITYDTSVTVTWTVDGGAPKSRVFDNLVPGDNVLTITETSPSGTSTKAVIVIFKESVILPPDRFGDGWNMVSFPDLDANISSNIITTPQKIRKFVDKATGYVKGEDQPFTLTPGAGYWMKVADVATLSNIKYGKLTQQSATVPVKQSWNLLGNPFSTDLPMNNIIMKYKDGSTKTYADAIKSKKIVNGVRKATEVIGYTWSWNQKDNRWDFIAINPENYKTDANKRTTVEPYRGFWMLIISDQISSIIINK